MTTLWTDQPIGPGVTLSPLVPAAPMGEITTITLLFAQPVFVHGDAALDLAFVDGSVVLARWGNLIRSSIKNGAVLQLVTAIGSSAQRTGQLRLTAAASWPPVLVNASFATAPPVIETPRAPVSRYRVRPLPINYPSGFTLDA